MPRTWLATCRPAAESRPGLAGMAAELDAQARPMGQGHDLQADGTIPPHFESRTLRMSAVLRSTARTASG